MLHKIKYLIIITKKCKSRHNEKLHSINSENYTGLICSQTNVIAMNRIFVRRLKNYTLEFLNGNLFCLKFTNSLGFHRILVAVLYFSIPAISTCQDLYEFEPHMLKNITRIASGDSATFYRLGEENLTIIGVITPTLAKTIKNLIDDSPQIKNLYVDSSGGDAESSMDISDIIEKHKIKLIVDGMCLSSCAEFLFVSAAKKIVFPGSIVGIHEGSFNYYRNGKKFQFHIGDISQNVKKINSGQYNEFKRIGMRLANFRKKFNVDEGLHLRYGDYLRNKIRYDDRRWYDFSFLWNKCPNIQVWALNKVQLESMGIKGIEEFWYPSSDVEKRRIESALIMSRDEIFFGNSETLERLCTKK